MKSVAHPMNKRAIVEMNQPVAISIRGVGILCYIELTSLPSEVKDVIRDRAYRLEQEIQRKADVLEQLRQIM